MTSKRTLIAVAAVVLTGGWILGCGARSEVAPGLAIDDDASLGADSSADGQDGPAVDAVSDHPLPDVALPDAPEIVCTYEGKTYKPYDYLTGPDHCSCRCAPNGRVTCSGYSCDADASAGLCDYFGIDYPVGDDWKCTDGCNACECKSPGRVGGTLIGCGVYTCTWQGEKVHTEETLLAPDGCNWCECWKSGEVTCTTTWFCL